MRSKGVVRPGCQWTCTHVERRRRKQLCIHVRFRPWSRLTFFFEWRLSSDSWKLTLEQTNQLPTWWAPVKTDLEFTRCALGTSDLSVRPFLLWLCSWFLTLHCRTEKNLSACSGSRECYLWWSLVGAESVADTFGGRGQLQCNYIVVVSEVGSSRS